MDFTDSTTWWVITVVLVAAELATGTFYLLMLAPGTAAAALAAHAGLGVSGQYVTGAVIGAAAVGAGAIPAVGSAKQSDAATNPDVNLDVGSSVQVAAWRPDGTARVHYRGAEWDARYAGTAPAEPGAHVIRAVQGSLLLLERMHG